MQWNFLVGLFAAPRMCVLYSAPCHVNFELESKISPKKSLTWGGFFDLAKQKDIVARLEQESSHPEFWQNTQGARKTMRELDTAKSSLATWNRVNQSVQDISTHLDLAEEAKGAAYRFSSGHLLLAASHGIPLKY